MEDETSQNSKPQGRWQRLKKKAVNSYQSAKSKYQDYKTERENLQFTEKISGVNIEHIDEHSSILRCSVCESAIPKELLLPLKAGQRIICEKCGTEITPKP
ncbi:hypothetical protein NEF87_003577 [Candidatus Lokiarchaeum ossiferum]|uniref:Uncharacterized protein n=1 Tax=Candidatus Lokiarchaeum ossiferum TaxID=2951803 RepID=A0ABY6HWT0_9ARCH|nr:hypothetical protein NEF87_003577 [Candidatus Lokiarchaeum sp. B-35]